MADREIQVPSGTFGHETKAFIRDNGEVYVRDGVFHETTVGYLEPDGLYAQEGIFGGRRKVLDIESDGSIRDMDGGLFSKGSYLGRVDGRGSLYGQDGTYQGRVKGWDDPVTPSDPPQEGARSSYWSGSSGSGYSGSGYSGGGSSGGGCSVVAAVIAIAVLVPLLYVCISIDGCMAKDREAKREIERAEAALVAKSNEELLVGTWVGELVESSGSAVKCGKAASCNPALTITDRAALAAYERHLDPWGKGKDSKYVYTTNVLRHSHSYSQESDVDPVTVSLDTDKNVVSKLRKENDHTMEPLYGLVLSTNPIDFGNGYWDRDGQSNTNCVKEVKLDGETLLVTFYTGLTYDKMYDAYYPTDKKATETYAFTKVE